MQTALQQNVQQQYEDNGYVIVRDVLDSALIEEARHHIDWLLERNPGVRPESLDVHLITQDAFWVRLISDDRLLDVAEQFIGPNIALFASHYIAKKPFDGMPVLWHQDGSYWPLDPMNVVTLWLAVDDSTPENGCLRVIPNTHHTELQQAMQRDDVKSVLGSSIDPQFVDETRAVDVILNAGDVSIHHPNTIHGSEANNSAKWRRGLTIRYIPTSTRILTNGTWSGAFWLRGEVVPGVNTYNPYPTFTVGQSMSFRDGEGWNRKADEHNRRLREVQP